ncbi:MAG: FtsQ-type POTRA domain-containing protein [Clostridia bacterium]|nr:FtsQ-type POTRA domain-containing protein [Clostridia bacterium]
MTNGMRRGSVGDRRNMQRNGSRAENAGSPYFRGRSDTGVYAPAKRTPGRVNDMYTRPFRVGGRSPDSIYNYEKMEAKGKDKVEEAREEAGEKKRFIKHKRGLILALTVIILFALIMTLIYKLVFVVTDIRIADVGSYTYEEILKASGINEGVNLYSFRASSVKSRITLNCPYIKDVDIDRQIPNRVVITPIEDKAAYYAVIFGEVKILSPGLRVLDTCKADAIPEGLVKIKIPAVDYAVTGRVLEFADAKNDRIVRSVLTEADSCFISDRITMIDARDPYAIAMICDGKHRLEFGTSEDIDYKLRTAATVLEDEMFGNDNKMTVDLTMKGKTGVVIDNMAETE